MISESTGLRRQDFELRGWKEICEFLGCEKDAARRKLKRMGLLVYDAHKPTLNKIIYQKVSLKHYVNLK